MSVYVCSDLHGQYELYCQMMATISDDDKLYVLGDVIDRGPGSIDILRDMMKRSNVVYLLGNHEYMMWAHETKDYAHDYWFNGNNGGRFTKSQLLKLSTEEQQAIKDYVFNQTKLQAEIVVNGNTFLLSHSYFLPEQSIVDSWQMMPYREVERVVWYSPWRSYEHVSVTAYNDGRIHVIGHVPVQAAREVDYETAKFFDKQPLDENYDRLEILRRDSIVNVDGGCAYLGLRYSPVNNCGLILLNLSKFGRADDTMYFQLNSPE